MQRSVSYPILIASLGLSVVVLMFLSLGIGTVWINPLNLIGSASGNEAEGYYLILSEIRLPRAILGVLVGGILGLSGAVLQGLLRNPLAEPGIVGVSASASLGAVIAIYSGLTALSVFMLPLLSLVGALIAVGLLFLLAGKRSDILTLILSGVAITTFAGAMTSLILNMSPNPFAAVEIIFWMMGSLSDRSLDHVWLSAPFIIIGAILLFATARALDALSLGYDVAGSLGVHLGRIQILAIIGTAMGVGAATAVTGAIGFVGLVVPHLLRPLVGNRPSLLLPVSMLGGSAFLLAADILVRVILPGKDLKLGVVTAIIGTPFFLWLLIKVRRRAGA